MTVRKRITDAVPPELRIRPAETLNLLNRFLADRVDQRGFAGIVLGLSGGIDSAVSAAIATRALGSKRVTGLFLPYTASDPRSEVDARLVADRLGIDLIRQPLTPFADSFFAAIPACNRVRKGNILARLRMIVLFDCSHKMDRLVLGTSNKTEILLGYGTWYGDTACSLNVIGDLYKTQVRQLARYLKIPGQIIEKPPSADLWPGQTDEGEIGMSYVLMDRLLYRLYDVRRLPREVQKEGFKPVLIRKIIKRVEANRFKSMLPEIARLPLPEGRVTSGEM